MKKTYDRIIDMRGNLLSVEAESVGIGELAQIFKQGGEKTYASVLSFDHHKVTLQCFENTRGIFTNDRVSFLKREMNLICSDTLLGRRLNRAGEPIDKGPPLTGE